VRQKKGKEKKGTLVEASVCILLPSVPISDYSKRMLLTRRADIQLMDDPPRLSSGFSFDGGGGPCSAHVSCQKGRRKKKPR